MSNEIHGLMTKVMRSLTEIGKDKNNDHFRFKYRGIDDAMNNLGTACRQHGVVTQWRTEHEATIPAVVGKGRAGLMTTLRGTLTFTAPDGSKIESSGYGVGFDDADKSGNKAMAAAFKYAVFMGLCIPVEAGALDDADADGMHAAPQAAPKATPRSRPQRAPMPKDFPPPGELPRLNDKDLVRWMNVAQELWGDTSPEFRAIQRVIDDRELARNGGK